MSKSDWRVRQQIAATDALINFLEQHDCFVPEDLRKSREAFAASDVELGCQYASRVRPHGMGGLTDGYPRPKSEHENENYCRVVNEALVRNWCFWVSVADDNSIPRWKRVIRAIGSLDR